MDQFKRNVKGHARIHVKKYMVSAAKYINLIRSDGEQVETFFEIYVVWKEWHKINNLDVPKNILHNVWLV